MLIEYTKNGRRRKVNADVAKVLIGKGLARAVDEAQQPEAAEAAPPVASPAAPVYDTRMLQADPAQAAPYGLKADGTPRLRPAPPRRAKEN
jgi:hypothetical protein